MMQCMSKISVWCSNPCRNWEYTPRKKIADPRTIASPSWKASAISPKVRKGIRSGRAITKSGRNVKARHPSASTSQKMDSLTEAEKTE